MATAAIKYHFLRSTDWLGEPLKIVAARVHVFSVAARMHVFSVAARMHVFSVAARVRKFIVSALG